MTIHYVKGDILGDKSQAIVIPVNCKGVMGAGLALEFKQRYPLGYYYYRMYYKQGDLNTGLVTYVAIHSLHSTFIFFPTKNDYRHKSKLQWIISGLKSLKQLITDKRLKSVAIPALGCGLGGLLWVDVKNAVEREFECFNECDVYFYEPVNTEVGF